jgi:hypothetical protein
VNATSWRVCGHPENGACRSSPRLRTLVVVRVAVRLAVTAAPRSVGTGDSGRRRRRYPSCEEFEADVDTIVDDTGVQATT